MFEAALQESQNVQNNPLILSGKDNIESEEGFEK